MQTQTLQLNPAPHVLATGPTAAELIGESGRVDDVTIERAGGDLLHSWYYIPHTASGDYVGWSVQRANRLAILERLDELDPEKAYTLELRDWYGYQALAVRGDYRGELCEIIDNLQGYPLIDEDLHSEIEDKAYNEALAEQLADGEIASAIKISRDAAKKLAELVPAWEWDRRYEIRDHACEETGELWYFDWSRIFRGYAAGDVIAWAMSIAERRSLILPCNGFDARVRTRAGKRELHFRRWCRRDWRAHGGTLAELVA